MKRTLFLTALLFLSAMVLRAIEPDPDLIWEDYSLSYNFKYVEFSPDDRYIVAQSGEQTLFFEPETGDILFDYKELNYSFSKDGSLMFSFTRQPAEKGQRIIVRSYPALDTVKIIPADNYDWLRGIKISPDNKHIAVNTKLWFKLAILNIETDEQKIIYDQLLKYGGTGLIGMSVNSWDFNFDGSEIAISVYYSLPHGLSFDGNAIYDLVGDSVKATLGRAQDVGYFPDGSILALIYNSTHGNITQLYDAETYEFIRDFEIVGKFIFSKEMKYLIQGGSSLKIYNYPELTLLREYQHPNPFDTPTKGDPVGIGVYNFSNDNSRVIAGNEFMLFIFDVSATQVEDKLTDNQKIYPNPTNSLVTIPLLLEKPGNLQIEISDMTGRNIKAIDMGFHDIGEHQIRLDVSDIIPGAYIVKAISNDFTQSYKLIKE